jgi:hypothetical protein
MKGTADVGWDQVTDRQRSMRDALAKRSAKRHTDRETDPRDLDLTRGHLVLGGSARGGKRWGWDFALFAFRV